MHIAKWYNGIFDTEVIVVFEVLSVLLRIILKVRPSKPTDKVLETTIVCWKIVFSYVSILLITSKLLIFSPTASIRLPPLDDETSPTAFMLMCILLNGVSTLGTVDATFRRELLAVPY
jgi:hypothetical protein